METIFGSRIQKIALTHAKQTRRAPQKHRSLANDLHVLVHVLFDVERTPLFYVNCSETPTIRKRVLTNLLERAWKRDFFDFAAAETFSPDVLYAVRNVDVRETVTASERLGLDPL